MSTLTAIKELRTMSVSDLEKELRTQLTVVRKMRIELTLNTEKDSARYRREKKQVSRLQTVLTEKRAGVLKEPTKTVTMALPKAPSTSSRSLRSGQAGQAKKTTKKKTSRSTT